MTRREPARLRPGPGLAVADEARIDAELATAQAAAMKAEAVNDEMRRGNETLLEEMQRQNGAGGTR